MNARHRLAALSAIAGLVALAFVAAPPVPARALSCLPVDVYDALQRADFAFIGRVVALGGGPPFQQERRVVFEVEQWVKSNLGSPVTVHGFVWSEPQMGQRAAMVVRGDGAGILRMDECLHVTPETLIAIAAMSGEPESTEQPAFLIGGEFGSARLMALDRLGRLVGWGGGQGSVSSISICPGGQRMVELAHDWETGPTVATRELPSLQVLDTARLIQRDDGRGWPEAVVCRDAEASDVLVVLAELGIAELRSGALHTGDWRLEHLTPDLALLLERSVGERDGIERFAISLLDLASGETTVLRPAGDPMEMLGGRISPDGAYAAVVEHDFLVDRRQGMLLHLFDLRDGTLLGSQAIPGPPACDGCAAHPMWTDGGRLVVHSHGWDEATQTVHSALRMVSVPALEIISDVRAGRGWMSRVGGGLLLSIDQPEGNHWLMAASIETGEEVEVRMIPGTNVTTLAVLPDFDAADADALLAGPRGSPTVTPSPAAEVPTPTGTPPTGTPQPGPGGEGSASADMTMWVVALALVGLAAGVTAGVFFIRRRS